MTVSDTRREPKEAPGTEVPVPPLTGRRIHELFETLAALVPGMRAVTAEGESLSYGELDRRANRLARYLRSLGMGIEERVAVALERSPEAVIALLAVWKAGGAWVPLDLSSSPERLGLLLEESGATFLIAREESAAVVAAAAPPWPLQSLGELPPLWQLRIVRLDRDAAEIDSQSAAPVRSAAGPEHLACLLDLAGTGPSAAVKATHRELVRRVLGLMCLPGGRPEAGHRILRLAPGRSLAIEEILLTLPHGAALHLAPPERLLGAAWSQLLAEQSITHLLLPPDLAHDLICHGGIPEDAGPAAFEALDFAIFPGHPYLLLREPAIRALAGPAEPSGAGER